MVVICHQANLSGRSRYCPWRQFPIIIVLRVRRRIFRSRRKWACPLAVPFSLKDRECSRRRFSNLLWPASWSFWNAGLLDCDFKNRIVLPSCVGLWNGKLLKYDVPSGGMEFWLLKNDAIYSAVCDCLCCRAAPFRVRRKPEYFMEFEVLPRARNQPTWRPCNSKQTHSAEWKPCTTRTRKRGNAGISWIIMPAKLRFLRWKWREIE